MAIKIHKYEIDERNPPNIVNGGDDARNPAINCNNNVVNKKRANAPMIDIPFPVSYYSIVIKSI